MSEATAWAYWIVGVLMLAMLVLTNLRIDMLKKLIDIYAEEKRYDEAD